VSLIVKSSRYLWVFIKKQERIITGSIFVFINSLIYAIVIVRSGSKRIKQLFILFNQGSVSAIVYYEENH